jgi:hypothetical protein
MISRDNFPQTLSRLDRVRQFLKSMAMPSVPDARWARWRRGISWTAIAIGFALMIETVFAYSPAVLIAALHHGREGNIRTIRAMAPQDQEKILRRMCFTLRYFQHGSPSNPYFTPNSDDCWDIHAPNARKDAPADG